MKPLFTIVLSTFFLTFIETHESEAQCLKSDSLELVKLYQGTNGIQWRHKWDLSRPVCKWHGIKLEVNGCSVKSIHLQHNNLTGNIPYLNLPNLESLHLQGNKLDGPIPNFDDLSRLKHLDLRHNYFTFEGIEGNLSIPNFFYEHQHIIPIAHSEVGNKLYVDAGGDLEQNTYYWYKDNIYYKTIQGDSVLAVTELGSYYCVIINSVVTRGHAPHRHGQNLVLESGQVVVKTITTYPPLPSKANLILKEKQQNESIIFEKQDDEPLLFPNPAKERVSIKLNYAIGKRVDIQILDQLGGLLRRHSIKQSPDITININVESLSKGYYYVRIQVDGKFMSTKLLIIQ